MIFEFIRTNEDEIDDEVVDGVVDFMFFRLSLSIVGVFETVETTGLLLFVCFDNLVYCNVLYSGKF